MARIDLPEGDAPEHLRVWGLRPEMAAGVGGMADAVYQRSALPGRVREAARMRVAMRNECVICLGWREPELATQGVDEQLYAAVLADELEGIGEREALAVAFADRFATDHLAIDDGMMAAMRAAFEDAEILDLAICCAQWVGMGRLNPVPGLDHGCRVVPPA